MGYQDKKSFTIGLFGVLTLVGALLTVLWLMTFQDPESLFGTVETTFFLIGGLSLAYLMVGVRIEPFKFGNLFLTMLMTALNVICLLYIQSLQLMTFGTQDALLVGVAEECFFRLFLCGLVYRLTRNSILAVIFSSAVWSMYHVARYGGGFNILFIIFICGCVLGTSFIFSRNADSCIFAHGIVNVIASAFKFGIVNLIAML